MKFQTSKLDFGSTKLEYGSTKQDFGSTKLDFGSTYPPPSICVMQVPGTSLPPPAVTSHRCRGVEGRGEGDTYVGEIIQHTNIRDLAEFKIVWGGGITDQKPKKIPRKKSLKQVA